MHPVRDGVRAADAARDPEARLAEAVGLAAAIALNVVHAETVRVREPRPATLFGTGGIDRLKGLIADLEIELILVNGALSPVQQRNLEQTWKCKVIDRTAVILEIFGARARTREGRLQVELAHLSYQRSRLVRSWTHLERQRGGFGFLGGPGESQLEIDRRLIDERIARLKDELSDVGRTRQIHRKARQRVPYPVIALVGYTNAGKSTLFNRLTDADVQVADMLFATLDPTMRKIELPSGRNAILSDTVGFISDLPTELIAAFHATLEEVQEADLVMHVRDVAHPESEAQKADVQAVLDKLGIAEGGGRPMIEVLNKLDLLEPERRELVLNAAERTNEPQIGVSALTGEGCPQLLSLVDEELAEGRDVIQVSVRLWDGKTIAWLYRNGEVMERQDDEEFAHIKVRLAEADQARFARLTDGGQAGESRLITH
ncbi:MAG: GTPase HflX [Alphaproteobacteria bacterium]|nr:GTPase HflX [Alphaproteobacteria bacterium]